MAYTISEAAGISGICPYTIRFYDKQGLLPFMNRNRAGVRQFSELDMECLEIISMLKATGMKIKEIKRYLDLCVLGDGALEQRLQFMRDHQAEVRRQMEEYKQYMEVIGYKIWYYETAIDAGTEYIHDKHWEDTGENARRRYLREAGDG